MKRWRHNLDLGERLASRCKSSFLEESEVEESSQNLEFRDSDPFEGILNKQTNKLWNTWMGALGVWRLASGPGYCNLGSFWPCSFCTQLAVSYQRNLASPSTCIMNPTVSNHLCHWPSPALIFERGGQTTWPLALIFAILPNWSLLLCFPM